MRNALKALEKNRDHRYQSAADLLRDIRHYLNREPIEAKPPTAWTRTLRWIARHPKAATSSVCTLIATVSLAATLTSIWVLKSRPHEIVINKRGTEARLISVGGGVLKTWTADPSGVIMFAELVDPPTAYDGGQLALVGFHHAGGQPHPNSLCAFEANGDFRQPVWERHVGSADIHPKLLRRGFVKEEFGVQLCLVADVFPDWPPGEQADEVVVVFSHVITSHRLIRIYDLTGKLLYQVWHDGTLKFCYWMSDAGLLLFSGLNSQYPWERRGVSGLDDREPSIVFAIRPQLDSIANDYLHTTSGGSPPTDDPLTPAWYKCLLPPEATKYVAGHRLVTPYGAHDPGRSVKYELSTDTDRQATVSWVLDESGNEVSVGRVVTDEYKRARKLPGSTLPDPDDFYLGDLPPVRVMKSEE